MFSKFLLFTHNDKNGLLAPNQAAHQARPNHAKALQGKNRVAHTQVDPISQEGSLIPLATVLLVVASLTMSGLFHALGWT
jgi:hypothetical protein